MREVAPALLDLGDDRHLAVASATRRAVLALDREGRLHPIPHDVVAAALTARIVSPLEERVSRALASSTRFKNRSASRSRRAARAVASHVVSAESIEAGVMVRVPASTELRVELDRAHARRRLGVSIALLAARWALTAFGWYWLGRAELDRRPDSSVFTGFALVLVAQVALSSLASWIQAHLSIDAGALLKRRILAGALELPVDRVRAEGVGRLLGRVFESDAIESLGIGAALGGLNAVVELALAFATLAVGAGGVAHVLALAAWIAVSGLLALSWFRTRLRSTDLRVAVTNDFVERMIGHRTRLVQMPARDRHDGEDHLLSSYADESIRSDRALVYLRSTARGWLLLAVATLVGVIALRDPPPAAIAVAIGGSLLASAALESLAQALTALGGATIAWRALARLRHREPNEQPEQRAPTRAGHARETGGALECKGVSFGYASGGRVVLRDCSLSLSPHERVLLEGSSGGGKSTLAALLAGLRRPSRGTVLIDGLDLATLGTRGWRARVACAPQFHLNHVFAGSFAFNLLMGRRWPPEPSDVKLAEELCAELGLSDLLQRMPAGLHQIVGETGWQLSHGERSRLFLARALLQGADFVILDESLGALDPDTLAQCLATIERRAKGVVLIAHP
ncbi:MAG: ABC transporter ATP-binding protein [Polyangiaceae bacterium]